MRRGRRNGCIAIAAGAAIFLALILPQWLWWIICAAALFWGGIWLYKCG